VIVCLLLCLLRREKTSPILIGSLCGVIFYFLAAYLAREGDTLQVLVAVLNTNFWLATHVIIITAGYGFCVITALMAHFALFAGVMNRPVSVQNGSLLLTMCLISLLLTALGTILGGIWADQSWGRFWGWDPKENGALLIVLWLIWIIHGRIAGQLKPTGFMIGAAALNVIVALAWFGVNLLGVGLHSYGFISGIVWGLLLFCLAELILIGGCALLIFRKKTNEN
jgi:ABC-type transport system involved in cytochrome c biogenesis permease subunit